MIYLYGPIQPWFHRTRVCRLESGVVYQAFNRDPRNGQEYPLGDYSYASMADVMDGGPQPPVKTPSLRSGRP